MSINHPNNAPDTLPPNASEETSVAAVLTNDALDQAPGGGGLLGISGSRDALSSTPTPTGFSPNAPMTVPGSRDSGEIGARQEAQVAPLGTSSEPHSSSR